MPHQPASLPKATGRDVQTDKVIELTRTQPAQYTLFGMFLPEEARDAYSNTLELYDAMPKYYASKKCMAELRQNGIFLDSLSRRFRHRDQYYELVITPARLRDKNRKEKEYYPSHQEEIVEEALKKLACDRSKAVFLNGTAGVEFTLYELHAELARQGHSMQWKDLLTSLEICRGAGIEVIGPEGPEKRTEVKSSIFPVVVLVNRAEWRRNPKQVKCYVQFNPMVTECINRLKYRQFNYNTYMQLQNRLARWLFKRLSHLYTQASFSTPYTIMHSTIVADSYLVNNARTRDQVHYVDEALEELRKKTIITWSKQTTTGPRKKILDVKYEIRPSLTFKDQIVQANQRHQAITDQALRSGVLSHEDHAQDLIKALDLPEKKGEQAQGALLPYPNRSRPLK